MYKFIKTKQFPAWCLVYTGEQSLDIDFDSRLQNDILLSVIHGKRGISLQALGILPKLDYDGLISKYKLDAVLIHVNGSWHTEKTPEITDTYYGIDFPTDMEKYDVVVCENDAEAPEEWIRRLQKISPDECIHVINYFRTRSIESIKEKFAKAKTITFSTTFMSFDWFEMVLEAADPLQHKIVGHCYDNEKIVIATEMAKQKNIEIIFI